jgi:hypothetical protein
MLLCICVHPSMNTLVPVEEEKKSLSWKLTCVKMTIYGHFDEVTAFVVINDV